MKYQRTDGTRFAGKGACTSYAARGGNLVLIPTNPTLDFLLTPDPDPRYGSSVDVQLQGFTPNTEYVILYDLDFASSDQDDSGIGSVVTDASGAASDFLGYLADGDRASVIVGDAADAEVNQELSERVSCP